MPGPKPVERPISFDRVAEVYDASRGLPEELQREVLAHLVPHLAGGRTLDIGAGTGRFSVPLQQEAGLEIVAIDVASRMLAVGRGRGLANAVLGDARRLPFADGSFDRAMSTHLLHLIADWPAAVREIVRVTRVEYLSVLERSRETPDLGVEYSAIARRHGVSTDSPGLSERRLPDLCPPERVEPVGGYRIARPATEVIEQLHRRLFRNQWDVPAALHRQIVRSLRREHARDDVESTGTVELAVWSVGRLGALYGVDRARPEPLAGNRAVR